MTKLIYICFLILPFSLSAQREMVPFDHVINNKEIIDLLDITYAPQLKEIQEKYNSGKQEQALKELTLYFKERFSERYLFDWKNFEKRFKEYNQVYSDRYIVHKIEAFKHLQLYPAKTKWKLPFENLKGETVTSYPYRHLTRQQKSGDIALMYYYTNNPKYLNYIPEQAVSLNQAFDKRLIETIEDGNGAYEAFRAGYRIFNWLFVHQCFLASEEYSWEQQLTMIRTFLHTGGQLHKNNSEFKWGNHQTRGVSALAMISILFPEIKGTNRWQERAFNRLEEHLDKEIYPDGFQFERSVHYNISDIRNFFYPYQLARLNNIKLNTIWEDRLKGLFEVLTKIAFPDKNAPVLQDDTDSPWSDMNKIDETMALGAALFESPEMNYFASSKISSGNYWWLRNEQIDNLKKLDKKKPDFNSVALSETGYFVMRDGWEQNDLYMITSAGLTPQKPDHQHGDMLGLGAYAYGNVILPNYQVRYYLDDLEVFKNSWVKNVMLVDSIPQGGEYKGNKGGSGFGKFGKLPVPKVLGWNSNSDFDFFAGSHNGYTEIGVNYFRSVLFVKDGFWIVNDQLISDGKKHLSQQIWQGHYDIEIENKHVRSVFPNGAGLEIIQLNNPADNISKTSIRSKGGVVFEKEFINEENRVTLLFPFSDFEERLDFFDESDFTIKGWKFSKILHSEVFQASAKQFISKENNFIIIGASELEINGIKYLLNDASNLWVKVAGNKFEITNCGVKEIVLNGNIVNQGETIIL